MNDNFALFFKTKNKIIKEWLVVRIRLNPVISEGFWDKVAGDILHNFKYAKNIELHILKVVFLLF